MVVRNVAIFTGGAVIGAVAVGTYFKSKQDVKAVAVPGAVTSPSPVPAPVPVPTPQPQVPARPSPPPVVSQPPTTGVGNPRKIMPHGFP
ncbi:hypothetical protein BGZ52_000313, partial [Haplosporangium bisporale]